MIQQYAFLLPPFPRGFHLITEQVLREIPQWPAQGLFHLFIQHTSAGLSLNENADPSVRVDFESTFNRLVPEGPAHYTHTLEGPDDMPAHIKTALVGNSLSLPITQHRLNLGTWQGIYLCEFRHHGGRRRLVATVYS